MQKLSGTLKLSDSQTGLITAAGCESAQSADKSIKVFFNGILLNRNDLHQRLNLSRNANPAEIIAALYKKHGTNGFAELNGPFVFALLDISGNQPILHLVRDQHGQKFLFFQRTDKGDVTFSETLSELKSQNGYDYNALKEYLSIGYIHAPRTIYKDIYKVSAAHSAVFGKSGFIQEAYWRPDFTPKQNLSFQEAADQTRLLLNHAVSRVLAIAPKAGVLLSGGIDSNLMLGLSTAQLGAAPDSFTIGFSHSGYDERSLAELAAKKAGSTNHPKQAEPRDFAILPDLLRRAGEPYADSSLLPTSLAMRLAASNVNTVITGNGGDELFGGYRRYQVMAMRALLGNAMSRFGGTFASLLLKCFPKHSEQRTILSNLRRLAYAMALPAVPCYASFQEIFPQNTLAELCPGLTDQHSYLDHWQCIYDNGLAKDPVEKVNEIDLLSYLPDDGCRKGVLAEQGTEITALSPMLDMDVTRFALHVPRAFRVNTRERKPLLTTVGAEFMPDLLLRQVKRGFGVPVAAWLRKELVEKTKEMASSLKEWDKEGWFSQHAVDALVRQHISGATDNGARIWTLLCLKMWLESK